jgi:hypothetical protein
MIQQRGKLHRAAARCNSCVKESGPFSECISVHGHASNVCGNCRYNGESRRCSFKSIYVPSQLYFRPNSDHFLVKGVEESPAKPRSSRRSAKERKPKAKKRDRSRSVLDDEDLSGEEEEPVKKKIRGVKVSKISLKAKIRVANGFLLKALTALQDVDAMLD